jgi:translation initiation factor IF-2
VDPTTIVPGGPPRRKHPKSCQDRELTLSGWHSVSLHHFGGIVPDSPGALKRVGGAQTGRDPIPPQVPAAPAGGRSRPVPIHPDPIRPTRPARRRRPAGRPLRDARPAVVYRRAGVKEPGRRWISRARPFQPAGGCHRVRPGRGRLRQGSGPGRAATDRPGPLPPKGLRRPATGRRPGPIAHPARPWSRPDPASGPAAAWSRSGCGRGGPGGAGGDGQAGPRPPGLRRRHPTVRRAGGDR